MSNYKSHTRKKSYSGATANGKPGSKLMMLPLIIIVALIPLIVRLKDYYAGLADYPWFFQTDKRIDFFLYYKSTIFITVSLILAFILIGQFLNHRILQTSNTGTNIFMDGGKYKYTRALLPLAVYAVLALLSTLLSEYSSFGYSGIFDHFESVFVLLGYCLVVYYAFLCVNTQEDVQLLVKWIMISVIVLCIIGLTQITGHDFLATTFGKKLFVPSLYWGRLHELEFNFEANRVYLTLYNPNYVGLYTSLISPILLVLLLFTRNKKLKVLYGTGFFGLLLCMVGSLSRNGFVALGVSLIFILIIFRKIFIKHWKISLGAIGFLIVAFFAINAYTGNVFTTRLQTMFQDIRTPEHALSSIKTNDDNVEITYNDNSIYIQSELLDDSYISLEALDADSNPIAMTLDPASGTYTITDPRFSTFTLQPVTFDSSFGFNVTIDGVNWFFTNQTGDGTFYFYNSNGKFDKIKEAESAVFTDYEPMGSGRGYIWSRTIPLLKERILIGSGADTFALVYPHSDYVGSYRNGFQALMTKPHSMYLQMAVQTGVLSLIAFLLFYILYFISCVRLYFKNEFKTYMSQAGAAIFVGTIGYMISGIFNDSTIAVSPIFWVLMGVGLAVNYRVKKELVDL